MAIDFQSLAYVPLQHQITHTIMKTLQIVYYASGENAGTYSPMCGLDEFTGDLAETCSRCRSWDDDGQVTVKMYNVCTPSVPDWMTDADYVSHHVALKYAVGLGGDTVLSFTRSAFLKFAELPETWQYWYGWAVMKSGKNAFLSSILSQFVAWLNSENTAYQSPLSPKQWDAASKFCPLYEARRTANNLYYSR